MKFLIDTNICIYYMKGRFGLDEKFESLPPGSLFISEITLAELKYGVANSSSPERNSKTLSNFLTGIQILPIFDALDTFANEKARLKRAGQPIDDFDLLIGSSAIANGLVLVTNNEKHFDRLIGIKLENWAK
ncbi:type II toxin-antitoxin system tRNA(fMet)-specific endonuclease VapC [Algoriphagus formosus]|uniref:Ribonuclease VapC n=1 Tax=Algoriphagus formosus TaxID=2007308 RepID=A0A4R5VDN5_9BACT|nr:type II toxin-antitoxin system VapC family toxin [Algoriphagus aquimaris]TDK50243.1 type II toxin-antitoxin system VapC family toxin [Algoriphagus aquimaris]